jgi:hypothetical protein
MKPIAKNACAVVLALSACTSTPPILPQRDFDRPTDVTFVCLGALPDGVPPNADGPAPRPVLTGRPMRWCHARNAPQDQAVDEQHRTFAFLPNSNSGELSVIDADNWKLVDLDPQIAGFNQAPLGVLPEQIASSDDGCRVVTVNHGSCDLSLVDPAALLAQTLHASYPDIEPTTGNQIFRQIRPRTASGRVLPVRAGELAFVPVATDLLPPAEQHLCRSNWTGQAIVTFPSCHLVALVDLPTGEIRDSFKVRGAPNDARVTVEHTGAEPECSVVDCAGSVASTADAGGSSVATDASDGAIAVDAAGGDAAGGDAAGGDAAAGDVVAGDAAGTPGDADATGDASDGGEASVAPGTPGSAADDNEPHPFAIAINPESRAHHAYVGLRDRPFVVGFDIDSTNQTLTLSGGDTAGVSDGIIALSEGAAGVSRLRLSIDPYLDNATPSVAGAFAGSFVGTTPRGDYPHGNDDPTKELPTDTSERKYLYVIARDASVRVIQVSGAQEIECETNPDPAQLPPGVNPAAACIPVGPKTPRRSTAVGGPGIRLSSPPVDIAVADVGWGTDHREESLGGVFAWILTANGSVSLLNINPTWRNTASFGETKALDKQCLMPNVDTACSNEPMPAPNTLRDRNVLSYSPALDSSSGPARLDFAPAVNITGPRLQSLWTRGTAANAATYSDQPIRTGVFFPANATPRQQTWAVTWEGALGSPRFSGQLNKRGGAVILQDLGMDYCRAGLQDKDLVTLRGCVDKTECGLGKVCAHGGSSAIGAGGLAIGGLCLDASVTTPDKTCGSLLNTVRRYEATTIAPDTALRPDRIQLLPHKDELVLPKGVYCHNPEQADGGTDAADGSRADAAMGVDALEAASIDAADGSTADAAADADAAAGADVPVGVDGAADGGVAGTGGAAGGGGAATDRAGGLSPTCVDPTDPSTKFSCTKDRQHCYQPCAKPGETLGCREGRTCVRFAPVGSTSDVCGDEECYCSDGPELTRVENFEICLGELLSYQLNVGGGYLVSGSQSGVPVTQLPGANGLCQDIERLDVRRVSRIPLTAATWCDASFDEGYDGRCIPPANAEDPVSPECSNPKDPATKGTADWDALVSTVKELPSPKNPCLFIGGANDSDSPALPARTTRHVQALFRNEEIQFMMTNLEQPHSGALQVRFDVSGGFLPQTVGLPGTVEIGMPARIVLGPFHSTLASTQATGAADSINTPYLFVVDQRRLGRAQGSSATRGQLLRIHPRGNVIQSPKTGNQPLYEDLSHSGNLFPIQ